ncbi:apoptosis regulator Bcl-2-like [Echeneis naucrates]|uniref:apoptosis regulator Bcl-2-like n=1 Tax=Echeneis naucrates TaxID=173247 RepID=UPI0011140358|nr:apoptosis regulator Bcl-2-like [Echeneis naucrates]XP_029384685.1 apoptosis regulator Bcl-2-like [Echeneis naucrates]XP_029384686.1 apoptosis regulator Bcl-2-like [Echeneis naucrates]
MVTSSRDIVDDFLRHRLLKRGVAWRFPSPPPSRPDTQHNQSLWRSEPGRRSHRSVAPVDVQQDPQLAPPQVQVALRSACDHLDFHHRGNLSAMVSVLLLLGSDSGRGALRQKLTTVREELFRDGVNWGRIVAMMEFGGALSTKAATLGRAWQVDDIATWLEESLDSPPLQEWIEDSGGWDAFVELHSESRPPVGFWSLRTVVGLIVLGAAGITLGVMFTQK